MKKKFITYIVFLICAVTMAQNPVELEVDTLNIRIGEQISYELLVDKSDNILFPVLVLDSLKHVEVVEELPVDTTKTKFIKKYILTSFDSGSYVIPRQQVLINNKAFKTDSLLISVTTVKVDTLKQKLFPFKAIKNQPIIFDDYKIYVWIGLAILALIIAVILYFVFRKKKEEIPLEERIPPYELAMKRLSQLDEKQLLQQDKIKLYYIELTDIIRTYIERELKIPALESTTDELIETIKDFSKVTTLNLPKETILKLEKLLQEADLVKFAKHKPFTNEIEGHRSQTEGIINNLKPEEVEVIDDFNQQVDIAVPLIEKRKIWTKKRIIVSSVIALLIIVFTVVGTIVYKSYRFAQENIVGYQSKELLNTSWSRSSYGYPSVSIESPKILKSREVQVPSQAKNTIDQMAHFEYSSLIGGVQISLNTVDFSSNVNQYDQEAGAGSILKIIKSTGGEVLSTSKEPISINGVGGIKVIAKLKAQNPLTKELSDYQLRAVIFGNVDGVRTIIVRYNDGDDDGEKIAERIINSIEL